MSNLKIEKKKEYNLFRTVTLKREQVARVKCYLRAVKQNTRDVFGIKKVAGMWYNNKGVHSTPTDHSAEMYNPETVYYYEVAANDGSYRKLSRKDDALVRFEQLVEFEKKQTEIR